MEKRSTVVILSGFLILCLGIMVLLGAKLYKTTTTKELLEKQNSEYVKEIDQLRSTEISLREGAADKRTSLDKEVVNIKKESKARTDEIEEAFTNELVELDTIEFYPLYVKLSRYGGAEAKD